MAQTGARLWQVRHYLEGDLFCLTYGDGLCNVNLTNLIEFHRNHGKLGTVTGVNPPGRFGELHLSQQHQVATFAEKPVNETGLVNGGFFVFNHEFIERYLHSRQDLVLEHEPLQQLAADGELMVYCHDGFWQPMDTYREWKILEDIWQSNIAPWKVWK